MAVVSAFTTLPNIDWYDPNLRFVDLSGDGHADILITQDNVFTRHLSLGEAGYGPAEQQRKVFDEEQGHGSYSPTAPNPFIWPTSPGISRTWRVSATVKFATGPISAMAVLTPRSRWTTPPL